MTLRSFAAPALLLLVALAAGGCMLDADRTVETKRLMDTSDPDVGFYSVAWLSPQYGVGGTGGEYRHDDSWVRDCYHAAQEGERPPFACTTRSVLQMETGHMTYRPWLSFGLLIAAIAITGLVAVRYVAATPGGTTAAAAAPGRREDRGPAAPASVPTTPGDSLALFRQADADKERFNPLRLHRLAFTDSGYTRRVFLRGLAGGTAFVVALGLLVGFDAGGEWGHLTAMSLTIAVIAAYLLLLLRTSHVNNAPHVRAIFAFGVAAGFLAGSLIGSIVLAPLVDGMLDWRGVTWFI